MRIVLVGGGTGGPVMPLIAVKQQILKKHPDAEFLFIGTDNQLERNIADQYGLPFASVPAGKWRRYFSLRNFLAPFEVFFGFLKSIYLLNVFKPDVIFGAGGFVTVPVVLAGFILRKKIVIHQQDVYPSLTNQLVAPLATKITVSFESSLRDFRINSGLFLQKTDSKIIWTGNPIRQELLEVQKDSKLIKQSFGIKNEEPVILVIGGATGAYALNQILQQALPELTNFAQVIHSTGTGKGIDTALNPNYHPYEIISNIAEAYAISDIVICRAGLSTISELSVLKKVSIIVPMPHSHQEYNAEVLHRANAALCFGQEELSTELLISTIRKIMYDASWQKQLKDNIGKIMPANAAEKVSDLIINLCQ